MQTTVRTVLTALTALGICAGAALAQTKDAPRCIGADGKPLTSADGKAITTQAECDRAGGVLKMQGM